MNTIADRLRDLVAEVTTFEENWEDKLSAALPSYDPCREGFPVEPYDEVRYFALCDDRAAEARDQLQKTTIGIEKVITELTPQPF
ncbi:hypothetical protein P3T35_000502 [Kitasatospora sp. GP30]|uniref:hypothetical protein n=1 Tax=Kitasatospora sp. GP30 TaxID=3035084 RepID=UPI000C702350|nr:hypothetical protein [Kitasatospora sp. GP30]MDH6138525.1 hypothetical protein [Kitasatospora sp. GP30]